MQTAGALVFPEHFLHLAPMRSQCHFVQQGASNCTTPSSTHWLEMVWYFKSTLGRPFCSIPLPCILLVCVHRDSRHIIVHFCTVITTVCIMIHWHISIPLYCSHSYTPKHYTKVIQANDEQCALDSTRVSTAMKSKVCHCSNKRCAIDWPLPTLTRMWVCSLLPVRE